MSEGEDFRQGARRRLDSSSSDDSAGPSNSRNKRVRVVIDSDGSGSSGEPLARRGRTRAAPLRDSDTDTSGWATDHSDAAEVTIPPPKDGFASDSSEGNSDKCSICLLRFTNQEIGTPQTCEHYFCLDCITEWSRNVNTCPVDRITFDAIVVKSCVGGTVLRTEPVKVAERRSSVDIVVVEEHTVCQLCNSAEGEETMLLCDGCDLGYHMACLEPPLITIPRGQWFCPNCISDDESVSISEVTDLLDELDDEMSLEARPLPPRLHILRVPRNMRRSRRSQGQRDQPSSSRQRNSNITNEGSTSRSRNSSQRVNECEVGSRIGKAKKKARKRRPNKKKARRPPRAPRAPRPPRPPRPPRTAARRAQVRECVRARLAAAALPADVTAARLRAGIQPLSIFGSPFELDYFGEEDDDGGGSVAMATRPTSHIISAYRQAQRKQITIPSPTHASTAPDILSSILESQSLLHSKGSIVSVSAGGQVNIKLLQKIKPKNGIVSKEPQPNVSKPTENKPIASKEKANDVSNNIDNKDDINKGVSERVDLNKEDSSLNVKETPMHPSQSRGGGFNHQNNYRGHGNFNNGGRHYDNNYGGDFNRNSQGNSFQGNVYNEGNSFESNYDRRPGFDGGFRQRRPNFEENRPFQRFNEPGRHSFGPPWQTSNPNRNPYQNNPRPIIEPRARHSFGGFEDPLDMRTGPNNFQQSSGNVNLNDISTQAMAPTNTNIPPLREPPAFKFNANIEIEKSEDEHDGLVIDTEKYDPTEPTLDEDSCNEDEQTDPAHDKSVDIQENISDNIPETIPLPQCPLPNKSLDKPVNISAAALDDAVRQVISQHSRLLTNLPESDEEDTGDCPNFSIYSATSVHIAQTTNIEETPSTETATVASVVEIKKPADAYNEKISKKCPITPNTRTPIKIKINTPSLIKRVNLYDEDEEQEEDEVEEPPKEVPKDIERKVEVISQNKNNYIPVTDEVSVPDIEMINEKARSIELEKSPERIIQTSEISEDQSDRTPIEDERDSPIIENTLSNNDNYFKTPERDFPPSDDEKSILSNKSIQSKQSLSESEKDEQPESCRPKTGKKKPPLEKMTESISETEDERSYTPCLDENKKENSIEADALQGLDTEMISEDEAQDTFPELPKEAEGTEEAPKSEEKEAPVKKKKKELKEKKSKKKSESFKKSGKTKNRNYRDKDKNRSRSLSHDRGDKSKSKKEKRKDLERYDVRNVVSEKRRRKDAFGRDIISPRRSSSPASPTRRGISESPVGRSSSRPKRSVSRPRRSTSRLRRSISRTLRSSSRAKRSLSRPRRSPVRAERSISRHRLKRSLSRKIRSLSRQRRSLSRKRASPPPRRHSPPFRRRSTSRRRSPSRKRSVSRGRPSPSRARRSLSRGRPSPSRARRSPSSPRHKRRRSPSPHKRRISLASPPRSPLRKKKKTVSPRRKSPARKDKRRKETEAKSKPIKKKKRDRSQSKEKKRRNRKKSASPKRKSPKRKKKRRSVTREPVVEVEPEWVWSGGSVRSERSDSRPPSPMTPPNPHNPHHHHRHRRIRDPPPSKEVFTSGDNILVSVSFKESSSTAAAEERRRARAARRVRRRALSTGAGAGGAGPGAGAGGAGAHEPRPVAIIDLERSPFREITPEPANVIVVSDNDKSPDERREPVGPKTPPESAPPPAAAPPRDPPDGPPPPAQYDPFEPTRSPSISSNAGDKEVSAPTESGLTSGPPETDRLAITLETAQKTNMSADDVLDQRPISPIEKVMALLKSTRDVSLECVPTSSPPQLPATPPSGDVPAPPPQAPPSPAPAPPAAAPPPRVSLPSPSRSSPLRPQPSKLFVSKPSPIKSTPIKPMPATKISSLPLPALRRLPDDSPYSPASSDFGELFSPPGGGGGGASGGKDAFDALMPRKKKSDASKVPVKRVKKKDGKHQVPVKLDDDNLKILDDLPSSAVEMQVKSKFLKKLNRQERVVEEVKLVLKPYYNRRRLSKEDYKDIMRRAVPKICHNKTGEINPTKIQSLVEAYVKKLRKKRKLGIS